MSFVEYQSDRYATPPQGVKIATEQVNGEEVQVVKLSTPETGQPVALPIGQSDAFGRFRVSDAFTLFDSKQLHNKQPIFWDESLGGSATSVHSAADARTKMSVTASASDFAIRQTKQRFNYQPGKSQLFFMTYRMTPISGVTRRVGPFDGTGTNNLTPNNGIFFEQTDSVSWNIAKNGTTTETAAQASWNIDPMDGTGPSGLTLDDSATQILVMDFEWLGVGTVRCGFVIDGAIVYVHSFHHANDSTFTSVYMSTPNAPLRYDIQSDGTNGGFIDHICSTIISEGGLEKTGTLRSVETGNTFSNTLSGGAGTKHALVGLRLKSGSPDISIIPESVVAVLATNDSFKWELQLNPTIAGTWTYSDLSDSAVQIAQLGASTTNTITADGLIIARGGSSQQSRVSSDQLNSAVRIGQTIAGVSDELVLVIGLLSNNQSIWACLNFNELL